MTSYRQIEANHRNALKSTGPKTEVGGDVSRRNAIRHGLTAEAVICALEDAEDYKAFEAAVTTDYDAQSSSRARTCVAVGQPSVAVAPRHDKGNWIIRDSSSTFTQLSANPPTAPRLSKSHSCRVRTGRTRRLRPAFGQWGASNKNRAGQLCRFSFDHLRSAIEHIWRERESQRLCGSQIDDEFDFCRLIDRQLCGRCAV
jgi:hypothetical protein